MNNILFFLYCVTLIAFGSAGILHLLRSPRAEIVSGALGLTANGAALAVIIATSGHMPFFGFFEAFLSAVFILAVLGFWGTRHGASLPNVRTWLWLEIALLLGVTLFTKKAPSPFQYDHDFIYIILFHGLRIGTLAVMLFASAHFFQFRIHRKKGGSGNRHLLQGRNFLVLSAALFLSAEYVGILWCQSGWGDFWMWSQGFFQSTLVVLYLMIFFHIPGRDGRSEGIRSLIGGLGGPALLALLVIRGMI